MHLVVKFKITRFTVSRVGTTHNPTIPPATWKMLRVRVKRLLACNLLVLFIACLLATSISTKLLLAVAIIIFANLIAMIALRNSHFANCISEALLDDC